MTLTIAAPERLETERLILRKPIPEDAAAIFTWSEPCDVFLYARIFLPEAGT